MPIAIAGHAAEMTVLRLDVELTVLRPAHRAFEEIGLSDEVGHHAGVRTMVNLFRSADLRDASVFQNGHAVGNGERLFLVVCDIDGGESELLADAADLGAHLETQLGVEVGERFVEKEAARTDDQGAGQGDALLLSAGKLRDLAVGVGFHAHVGQRAGHALFDFRPRYATFLQSEGDIPRHGEVRPEGVALEHHARVALVRRDMGHIVLVEKNAPLLGHVKSGDVAEQGGLAAAARAEQEKELAFLDAQIDPVQGRHLAEFFGQIFDGDGGHTGSREESVLCGSGANLPVLQNRNKPARPRILEGLGSRSGVAPTKQPGRFLN